MLLLNIKEKKRSKIEMRTITTTVTKLNLKKLFNEGNTCIAEPNLEVSYFA